MILITNYRKKQSKITGIKNALIIQQVLIAKFIKKLQIQVNKKDLMCNDLKSLEIVMELPGRQSNKYIKVSYDWLW